MSIKSFIPKIVKLRLRQLLRLLQDQLTGVRFASLRNDSSPFNYSVTLTQPIKVAHLYENKIENLKLAGSKINEVVIAPGEIFSFWKVIGDPSEKNGYKKGRNIVSGVMSEEYGGGLCQLSGILYHLSLMTGLEVVERYNHSVDFYTDENRYTPIGCDATVVYGYKDLRIRNNLNRPIRFAIETADDTLIAVLYSPSQVSQLTLFFERKEYDNSIEVTGMNESGEKINHSKYLKKGA
jgi:vancomycin resistance protein VanW